MALELPPDARTFAFQRQGAVGISDPPPTPQLHAPLLRHWCWYRRQIGLQLRLTVAGGGVPLLRAGHGQTPTTGGTRFPEDARPDSGNRAPGRNLLCVQVRPSPVGKGRGQGGSTASQLLGGGRADGAFAFLTQIFPGGSAPGPRPRDLGRGQRPLFSAALGSRRTSFDSETP